MIYAFGNYKLDISCPELLHSKSPLRIRRKVSEIRSYFVQCCNQFIPRKELVEVCGPTHSSEMEIYPNISRGYVVLLETMKQSKNTLGHYNAEIHLRF